MGWGSRQAPLFCVWWKTSNTWPWGSSPSHRNRGTHIKTPLRTAAAAVSHYKTLFCSCFPSEYIYLISTIIIIFKMQYLTENTLIVETCMTWFPFLSSLCNPELSCMLSNLQFVVKSPIVSCKKNIFYFQQQSLWGLMSDSSTSCESCSVVCWKDILKNLLGQKTLKSILTFLLWNVVLLKLSGVQNFFVSLVRVCQIGVSEPTKWSVPPFRLKPVHKIEGMTNGTAAGAGQQQQQQQGSGQVDISTQVQQYQQFLGAD